MTVSATHVIGGQCFGEFSGGNAREQMNFGRCLEVVSRGPEYTYIVNPLYYKCPLIYFCTVGYLNKILLKYIYFQT